MPGVHERRFHPLHDVKRRAVVHRLELGEGAEHVAGVVDRLDLRLALVALAVEVVRVFVLNLRGVAEHDGCEGAGRPCAVDRSGEPAAHEVGQVAAVIDVRVAENHRVDALGAEREVPVPACALGPAALEQPAVEEDRFAVGGELVHRPGHGARRAQKVTVGSAGVDFGTSPPASVLESRLQPASKLGTA